MKKLLVIGATSLMLFAGSNMDASAAKAKDFVPKKGKTYITSGNGYYLNSYKIKSKKFYKNSYWYDYEYNYKSKKYESFYSLKYKYVMKKDGLYMVGKQPDYTDMADVQFKVLPTNIKKGMTYKAVSQFNHTKYYATNKIVSTTEKVKVGKKTYKNVVKVMEDITSSSTNYKYYAKGVGVIKSHGTNNQSGGSKMKWSSSLTSIISK